ncbi:hypothetical protein BRETT_001891 [Brettanomyces bruxellensis]|uniref:ERCC4 domain-containing protein n=2 Tax=Dekkera bruxellensis TaxID=5007 RepID=A0A871R9M6_DEKBR|nr:uncharacterized protein BRETT_001891 [Brettanomyces bruxellensis]QOU18820.1 hypothetical protein BRETT_001891 [Brettanomyces bruxellensis]
MSESLFVPDDNPSEVFNDDESNVRKTNSQNPSNNGVSSKEHTIEEYTTQEGTTQNLNLEPIQAATSLNLKYQQEIVRQLISQDALVILGRGLGIEKIVANLLQILGISTSGTKKRKKSLIFLINASEYENFRIGEDLMELSWMNEDSVDGNENVQFTVIGAGEGTTVDKRRATYERGGIISLSNRVLVTDLLAEVVDPGSVTGIVLLHAENVREYSNDRFVVNLYRRKNKWGFVKAFSEDPERLSIGFQPLYTELKFLKLQKALLWPRFHIDVTRSLRSRKRSDNTVTEVRVKLTSYTEKIQNALMSCIEALIGELRRNNPDVASDYWTIDNALDNNFVQRIHMGLEPVWHRISLTTRQIVFDLETLKMLLKHLLERDCVEFYGELNGIVEANKPTITRNNKAMATWLMLDESMAMIACAKARIFDKIKDSDKHNEESTYLLEEQPKWDQLSIILEDINREKMVHDSSNDGPTLIMCYSYHTCRQLRYYLSTCKDYTLPGGQKIYSGRKYMINQLKRYIQEKRGPQTRNIKIQRDLNEDARIHDTHSEVEGTAAAENANAADKLNISKTFLRGRQPSSKRRRTRGGSIIAEHDRLLDKDVGGDESGKIDEEMILELETQMVSNNDSEESDEDDDLMVLGSNEYDNDDGKENGKSASWRAIDLDYIDRSNQLIIEQYNSKSDDLLLEEFMPSNVILYEPNLLFIRKIEQYQAERRKSDRAKCYFMYYGGSVEEQRYLNDIKCEKDSFTKLIREKANMPKVFTTDEDEVSKFSTPVETNTRIAGGGTTAIAKVKVIVDMREFRSHLPFLCHLSGLEVIPCMLTVGDYILSPKICVERKSLPDLVGSLKNGRLYQQCEQMFRYYERPTLLIEFEEGKSFSLQPFTTFKNGVLMRTTNAENTYVQRDLQLKLMVLLTSYPSLRILWTSSPFETAKLFKELKLNQNEPDVTEAVSKGLNPLFDQESLFNDMSIDLIQSIPGINTVNYTLIMSKIKSLYELSHTSIEDLAKIIGHSAASKVVDFFEKHI